MENAFGQPHDPGAPPGYVGYDEGRALHRSRATPALQVVLFDLEVEKAHRDVFNDAPASPRRRSADRRPEGRTVDFRNTLIIMTSRPRLGVPGRPVSVSADGEAQSRRGGRARWSWTSCANALPARVPATGSTRSSSSSGSALSRWTPASSRSSSPGSSSSPIAGSSLLSRRKRPALRLAERGADPVYGAQPLRRVIQKELMDLVAKKLLAGEIADGSVVDVHGFERRLVNQRTPARSAGWLVGLSRQAEPPRRSQSEPDQRNAAVRWRARRSAVPCSRTGEARATHVTDIASAHQTRPARAGGLGLRRDDRRSGDYARAPARSSRSASRRSVRIRAAALPSTRGSPR